MEFRLPELGENIVTADVSKVRVAVGAAVALGAPLLDIETEKASVEVPSPVAGRIEQVAVRAGEKIKVGQLLFVIAEGAAAAPAVKTPVAAAAPAPAEKPAAPPHARPGPPPAGRVSAPAPVLRAPATAPIPAGNGHSPVPAGPATRRLARELGVDLRFVRGSGRAGRVTLDDVKAFVRGNGGRPAPVPATVEPAAPPLPDFAQWGEIERKPIYAIRRKTAEHMALSWRVCPQVTQYDLADITELEAARKKLVAAAGAGAPKVTMTVLAVKAIAALLREMPNFNSSYDPAADEMVFKKYVHIGLAVDTEHGLLVPVVRDADRKSLTELAAEIVELAEKARSRKLTLAEMRGGTFTISNLGGVGGTAFSPIVNYPEVAILGLARSSQQYVLRDGKPEFRLMLPLCLTYDHRVIDGADAARFTGRLAALLADPGKLIG
jgi:pyruvate dehydrogenase E2 component (dihydrolipoamide acetyltransferase)